MPSVGAARIRLGLGGPGNYRERHELIKAVGRPEPPPRQLEPREVAALARRFAPGWLRQQVLERDGFKCRYCGETVTDATANMDHLKPWPYGMTELPNLVTSCRDCNRNKGRSEAPRWSRKAAKRR